MKRRKQWLKNAIAMITLIAMVIETGFSSIPVYGAELTSDSGSEINIDIDEDTLTGDALAEDTLTNDASSDDVLTEDAGTGEDLTEEAGDAAPSEDVSEPEKSEEAPDARLDVTDSGIKGSGYEDISIYIDTTNLDKKDRFNVVFTGPDSASYNPVLNDELDKTNGGRYYFEDLEGSDFVIRATSKDSVILSYNYNNGNPVIVAESKLVDRSLKVKTLTAVNDSEVSAVEGEGYNSVKVSFNTEDLTDGETFAFFVETSASATVGGKDATKGIKGLDKNTGSLTIEGLNKDSFIAYVVSDDDGGKVKGIAGVDSVAEGEVIFTVDRLDTKRIYEYEDSKVKVTATLEKADAVPDEAEFIVTEVNPESVDYNYETYMNALNENAGEIAGEESESVVFNDNNTLLYDIGFFVEEDGTKVEFEPEEGSVRFEIEFKDQQLSEAENDSAISVVHLPLKESVKDNVDTTAEAVNITTSDVKVEVVENNSASVAAGTVGFNLDDLSVVAIIDRDHSDRVGTLEADPAGGFTTRELLGNSWTYGVTAYNLNLVRGGDAETNFATRNLDNRSCSQTGMTDKAAGSLHSYYIVENFTGQQLKLKDVMDVDVIIPNDSYIDVNKQIISTDTVHNQNPHVTFQKKGRINVQTLVNNMLANATSRSEALAGFNSVKDKNLGVLSNSNKVVLDLTKDPAGTYYFKLDELPVIKNALAQNGNFAIKKNDDQKIVFNYLGTDTISLDKYILNNSDSVGMANQSSRAGTHIEDIIFNFPNASKVKLNDQAGIFIAPKATVEVSGVGGGWIIANTVDLNCEWHFTNGEIPKPGDLDVVIPVKKIFEGGANNWRGGFRFTLQEIADGSWNNIGEEKEIILNGVTSEEAIGQFELTFDPTTLGYSPLAYYEDRYKEGYRKVCAKWYRVTEDITFEHRDDVEYNIYDKNPWGEAPNSDYWYIHLFIYSDDNYQNMLAVARTARKNPDGYDYARYGLPCEEGRPIIFKNRYRVLETDVKLEGIKEVKGLRGDVPSGKFEFSLYDYKGGGQFATTPKEIDGVVQRKTNDGASISFDRFTLNFNKATDWNNKDRNQATEAYFYFLIKETKCEAPYTADDSEYVAKVILKKENGEINSYVEYYRFERDENGNSTLDVNKAMKGQTDTFTFKTCNFKFKNKYNAKGDVTIYGQKKIENRTFKKGDKFTFTLTPKDVNGVSDKNNEAQEITIEPSEEDGYNYDFEFAPLKYTLADIPDEATSQQYVYEVKETRVDAQNVTRDTRTYEVVVTVEENGSGALNVSADKGTKLKRLKFINIYDASGSEKFGAHKTYGTGLSSLADDKEFTFIFEGDGIDGEIKGVATGEHDAIFPGGLPYVTVSYNSIKDVGTYHYTIREELPAGATKENNYTVDGIIYDPRVYTYTVEVSDGGNGQLVTDVSGAYDDGTTAEDVRMPEFINDYAAKPVEGYFGGTKILHGQKMLERGQFEFALSVKDSTTKKAVEDNLVVLPEDLIVKNGLPETVVKKGKEEKLAVDEFWFGNFTFKAVGTYQFNVKEVIPTDDTKNENMVYSEDEYVAIIVIDDDANGQLYVKDTSFGKVIEGGQISKVGKISFINTEYKPGEIPLYAFKDLSGRELKEGQFEFKLEGEGVTQTAANAKNGIATFENLEYEFKDLKGKPSRVFTYTIREIIPDDAISEETGKKYKDDPNSKTYKKDGYTYDGHVENVHVTISSDTDENGNGILNVTSDNATADKMAIFRNTYEAEGDTVIEGIKKLHGRKFTKEDSGKFVAELYFVEGPEGYEYKIGDRVINKDDLIERVDIVKDTRDFGEYGASFEFSKLYYTHEGVYTYKVKESETDTVNNVTNSTEVYTVKVTVTDINGDGKYTVAKDKTRKDICFINTWNADNKTDIIARKRVNGEYFADKLFKFDLADYETGDVIKTVTNGDGGYITFENLDELTYSQEDLDEDGHGEKVYKLYEEVQTVAGYKLSDAEYTVKVYLDLNNEGGIDVSKFYFDKAGNPVREADVVFDNIYETTGDVELFAYKKVVGADVEAGKFTFQLMDEEGNIVGEAQNVAAKAGEKTKASFPAIIYTKDDLDGDVSHDIGDGKFAKIYTMREFIPEQAVTTDNGKTYKLDGFTYDTTVYDVIVTLEDNGKGKIETEWFAFKSGTVHKEPNLWQKFWNGVVEFITGYGKEQDAAFENIYEAEGAIELSARKILKGKTLNPEEFSFILSGTNENGDSFKQTKTNDADGNVVFDRITFTHEGSYTYTIKEVIPGEPVDGIFVLNGVKYDTTEYTISVNVTDLKNGKLQVTAEVAGQPQVTSVEVTDADGKVISLCKPEAVMFTNEYECKPVKVGLGGEKFLAGRPIVDKEFSFTLDKAEGNNKKGGVPQTVFNNGEKFSFEEIEFTFDDMSNGDGTYADSRDFAYTINEVIPSNDAKKPGVTYNVANAVFDVVITVTNNAGRLDAVVKSRNLNSDASYAFVDPLEAAKFLNTYEADGEIVFTVEKAVQGTDDDETVFTFELKGDGLDVPMHTTAVNGETASFETIKYTLADLGEPLADGTYKKTFNYEVTEVVPDDKGGYEYADDVYKAEVVVTSEGDGGKLTVSENVTRNGAYYEPKKPMEFINKYNANGFVEIPGTKYLEGRELTDQEFQFILLAKDTKGEFSKVATTYNDADGNFKFRIDYNESSIGKTYYYKVREVFPDDAEQQGMVCDDSIYDVEVTVTDNKDGKLTTTKKFKKNGVEVPERVITSCDFVNKIVEPDSVKFSAIKLLEGDNINNYTFNFELLEGSTSKQTVSNKGEYVGFDSIQYKLEDAGKTFHYTIKEIVEKEDGVIIFDRTLYTADVTVKLNDTKLDITTVYKKGDQIINADDIKFINKYRSTTSVKFGGEKILKGFVDDKTTPLGKYTFELYNATGNMIDSAEVEPKTPTDPTKYEFKEIEYTQDDYNNSESTGHKFIYTVREHVPVQKAANVTYSDMVYHVYVELYKDADNKLQARSWTDENVDPTNGLVFENRYAAKNEIVIDGIKTISGNNLEDGKYTFVLEGKDKDSAVKYEVSNKGALFSFPAIKYEQADIGEHVYVVTESAETGDGSQYDSSEFTVKVNVSEGKDGVLEVNSQTTKKDADGKEYKLGPKEDISFNNVFKANGQIGLEGRKILENKPLKANDFWFVLKDENGNELQKVTCGSSPLKSKNDLTAESTFKFDDLKFTEADLKAGGNSYLKEIKKYYTVEELRGNKGGYIYSGEVYAIEVTVKSDGSNKLDVSKRIVAKNKTAASESEGKSAVDLLKFLFADKSGDAEIVFKNSYDSECIIDPPILRKQVMGKNIERGEFEFKVEGPGLKSMGEEKTGYVRNIKNGINTADGSIYYPDGSVIAEGEIYVGDIKYKYIDLDIDLETGEASRTFEYIATEIPGSDKAFDYSPQKFRLTVTAIDDGEGHMYTVPEIKDMKWEPITPYALSDEQMNDTFLNIFNQEGSIDIVGIKKLSGRQLTKDDKFEFTITDDKTGASVTRTNTEDANGVPRMVEFKAKDKDGNVDISFLNYKFGAYEVNPDRKDGEEAKFIPVDDTGVHTYTIVEKNIDKAGIKCDTATFKVYVDVQPSRKADGSYEYDAKGHAKLNARITDVEKIYSDNNKVKFDFAGNNSFEFINEYKATGKVSFSGSKFLNDQTGAPSELTGGMKDMYGFALYQYDDAARKQGKTLIDDQKTDKDGKFTLEVPEYDQEVLKNEKGEYETTKTLYYRIVESKPSNGTWSENNTVFESEGVIYDNTEYDVDVTISYDGTQALKITKDIKKAATGEAVTGIAFTNIENKEFVTVEGTKTWVDDVKDAKTRPDVVVSLYSSAVNNGNKAINTYTIKAPATTYKFTTDAEGNPLPAYDAKDKVIKYTVEEAPVKGYVSEKKGYDFYNTKGHVTIQKLDADTNEPLAGASLAIYDGKSEVEKWTSEVSAHVVKAELTAGKTYTLRELAAPSGYELASDISFTVPADGSDITVTMTDKAVIGSVKLVKRDSSTRSTLAGAEFALYNNDGSRIYATGSTGKYSATSSTSNGVFTTDSSGSLVINNLPFGAYYFTETKAPDGYTLSSEKLGFTVANSSQVVEVTFLNSESVGAVRLRKVGADGSRTLEGARFELYSKTPRTVGQAVTSTVFQDSYYRYGTYTTNSSGEIYVDKLPWDSYYFVEVQAPDGYEIATDVGGEPLAYTFTVDASSSGSTIDLGDIINNPIYEEVPPESGVLGARVANDVLGVRSQPKNGVLGARVGPATGDASAIALWLTLLVACVGTIVWLLASRKKTASK